MKKTKYLVRTSAVGLLACLMVMSFASGSAGPGQEPAKIKKFDQVIRLGCDCQANAQKFDARNCRVVPPSRGRDQMGCGSCWAFAAAAAFEISYCIVNPDVNPADVDVSEQHILSCSAGSCIGTLPEIALRWMKEHRIEKESALMYQEAHFDCPYQDASTDYITSDWGYVDKANPLYPSREEIKEAICRHGSVISCFTATDTFRNNGWGTPAQRNIIAREKPPLPTNHVVTIVGWDDDIHAWLVRNSWSSDWGLGGYVWVDYFSHNIGYDACWVDAKPKKFKKITVKNLIGKGSYNTDLTISYDVSGFRRVDDNNFPVGQSRTRLIPEHARNIRVTANAVGGRRIFSYNYDRPQDLCFEVWGTTLDPKHTACYEEPSVTKTVVVNNVIGRSTYVTKLTVTFRWNNQDFREERTIAVGQSGKVEVPAEATDVKVVAKAVAGETIFTERRDKAEDMCFDVLGTTLNTDYSLCIKTDGCYKHITLKNRVGGGYAAEATVTYSLGGQRQPSVRSGSFAIGMIRRLTVPCEATDIDLVVKAIGGETILTKNFPQAVDRCYEVWGTTLNTHYQACDEPTDCKRRIEVKNSGAYVAEFTVKYDFQGERFTKESGSFAVGKSREITIPCDATNVEVKAKAVGGKTIFTETFPTAVDKCYRVKGTSLFPKKEGC